ncbi:hypothetical protein BC830DRAFT_1110757 [Chytriomyces sp. MP71]|nr:hypothetical protein BC830DRAFT_1110757 [Chytriomyces sp. MP71]
MVTKQPSDKHFVAMLGPIVSMLLFSSALAQTFNGIEDHLDIQITPGKLCTPNDPYYNPSRSTDWPRCDRGTFPSTAIKQQVASSYGIPENLWNQYEFDHLIPLEIGGTNAVENLWPQPGPLHYGEAGAKDTVENQAGRALAAGTITQQEAIQMILDWLNTNYGTRYTVTLYGFGGPLPPVVTTKKVTSSARVPTSTAEPVPVPTTTTAFPATGGSCPHPECQVGKKMAHACSDCASAIFEQRAYCSTGKWDATCVSLASSLCGLAAC